MPLRALEVRDLWFRYPEGEWVLKGIDLEIEEGEMVAIMGENGAGKTTLIKHFVGLLKPFRGYVKVFGIDTRKATVAELARVVGIVFQNPDHQIFAESVLEEVLFALRNFGWNSNEALTRARKVLENFGLWQLHDRSPFTLSGGEKKRLTIASVLVYDPDIIILDEPTIGQDYRQKKMLADIIKKLNSRGKTVIVVSHDIEFVVDNFDNVLIMAQGRILARGAPEKVLTDKKIIGKARLLLPQLAKVSDYLKGMVKFEGNYLRVEQFVNCIIQALGGNYESSQRL